MSFSTLPNFGKVAKKVATFSLLPNFGNYIRNHTKILASCQNFGNYAKKLAMPKFGKFFFGIKVNRPLISNVSPALFNNNERNYTIRHFISNSILNVFS